MKVIDHLSKEEIKQLNKLSRNPTPKTNTPKKKRAEKLSQSDIKDLMGVNRDTYKRKNGAIRRK